MQCRRSPSCPWMLGIQRAPPLTGSVAHRGRLGRGGWPAQSPAGGETLRSSERERRDRRAAAEGAWDRNPRDLGRALADGVDGVSERLLAHAMSAAEDAQGLEGVRQVAVGKVGLPALLGGHRAEVLLERFARETESVRLR